MLNSSKEIQSFIKTLFMSSEIEINGIMSDQYDLIMLCERVSNGKENIKSQKQYIRHGHIEKICVTTF